MEILQIQIWDYFMIGVKCHSHVDLHPNFIKFESIFWIRERDRVIKLSHDILGDSTISFSPFL